MAWGGSSVGVNVGPETQKIIVNNLGHYQGPSLLSTCLKLLGNLLESKLELCLNIWEVGQSKALWIEDTGGQWPREAPWPSPSSFTSAIWEPSELGGGFEISSAPSKSGRQSQPVNWGVGQGLHLHSLRFLIPLIIDTWDSLMSGETEADILFKNTMPLKGVNKGGNWGLGLWSLTPDSVPPSFQPYPECLKMELEPWNQWLKYYNTVPIAFCNFCFRAGRNVVRRWPAASQGEMLGEPVLSPLWLCMFSLQSREKLSSD